MKLEALREKLQTSGGAGGLAKISGLVGQMIQETRSLTFELGSPVLYEVGFEAAVEELVEQLQEQHAISLEFEDDGHPKPLDDDVRFLLFKAARELLCNVVRHARAHNAKLSIRREGQNIRVKVEDDGIGFEVPGMLSDMSQSGSFGLFSVRERLHHVGGDLVIESQPGRGTRATLVAPLKGGVDGTNTQEDNKGPAG